MSLSEIMDGGAALGWTGYAVLRGPHRETDEPAAEWNLSAADNGEISSLGKVVMAGRLIEAVRRQSQAIPSQPIATIRDTLLPKMHSGKVSVPTAGEMVALS
jgi:hypothetical protein